MPFFPDLPPPIIVIYLVPVFFIKFREDNHHLHRVLHCNASISCRAYTQYVSVGCRWVLGSGMELSLNGVKAPQHKGWGGKGGSFQRLGTGLGLTPVVSFPASLSSLKYILVKLNVGEGRLVSV